MEHISIPNNKETLSNDLDVINSCHKKYIKLSKKRKIISNENISICKKCSKNTYKKYFCSNCHEVYCNSCIKISTRCFSCEYPLSISTSLKHIKKSQKMSNKKLEICYQSKFNSSNEECIRSSEIEMIIEEFKKQISQLEKKINEIKSCCVCHFRGRVIRCYSCNFKSCNFCYSECLICKNKSCLNCIKEPKIKCREKSCKNIICMECDKIDKENEIEKLYKMCGTCKKLKCVDNHKLKLCNLCLEKNCNECFVKCKNCKGIYCLNCNRTENKIPHCKSPEIDFYPNDIFANHKYCSQHSLLKSVLIGCGNGSIINFDTINMQITNEFSVASDDCKISSILYHNGKLVTGLADEYKIKIYNDRTFDPYLFTEMECGFTHEIQPIRDNVVCTVSQIPHQVKLIDINQNKTLHEISFMDFVPNTICKVNNHVCLIGFHNGWIKLWDFKTGKITNQINAHAGKIVNSIIRLTKHEGWMSGGQDRSLKIWTLEDSSKFTEISIDKMLRANVTLANWSKLKELKDGRVVHCSGNKSISIWDLRSATNVILKKHNNSVYDFLQISDNVMLSCSEDKFIKKWDLRKNDVLDSYSHKSVVYRFEI